LGADFTTNVNVVIQAVYDSGFDNEYDVVFKCAGVENVISNSVFLVKKVRYISMFGIFVVTDSYNYR